MGKYLKQFLDRKQREVRKRRPPPIITIWVNRPSMNKCLDIIDLHVEYLLKEQGGIQKLDQWIISDDISFNTITAERYIIKYLQNKNNNIVDNLDRKGIDAHFFDRGNPIGIEVTTLNKDIFDWVFTERLIQFVKSDDTLFGLTEISLQLAV
jgi:hypothetical protein